MDLLLLRKKILEKKKDFGEERALVSQFERNKSNWIIDSGFSHHMTFEKIKFEHLEHYDLVEVLDLEIMSHVM